jgi:hypothetical protein
LLRIEAGSDQPETELIDVEINRCEGDVRGHGDAGSLELVTFRLLAGTMVDLEEVKALRPGWLSVRERVEPGAEHHVLGDAALHGLK